MILIIDNRNETTEKYIADFRDLGINAFGASESECAELISSYCFNAFLIVDSESLECPTRICENLKSVLPRTPLIILAKNESENQLDELNIYADNIILPNVTLKKALPVIMEYIRIYSGRSRTDMIHKSVRVELYSQSVFFFGERFHTSKSEYSVIRYLVDVADIVSLEDIKKFCFRLSSDISNHAVIELISRINLRAEKLFNKKMITSVGNGKYIIAV